MTRPRPYAIGHKVNSLLFEPSLSTCETWLLPHAWTLHTLRYNQDDHGESKDQGQAWKRRRKKGEEEDGAAVGARPDIRTVVRIIRAQPDHPDPPPDHPANSTEDYRSLPPEAGSSGPRPGSSGPCPDVRTASRTSGPAPPPAESPDHPGLHPDHPDQPGSSGQRLCARVGLSPCTPSPPSL